MSNPPHQPASITRTGHEVLRARYLRRDAAGQVTETPDAMFRRVAKHLAAAEQRFGQAPAAFEEDAYRAMSGLDLLPSSPILMNAGTGIGALAACYVLPLGDSMAEILDTAKQTGLVFKDGGGVGIAFSRLRPKGDSVSAAKGVASGPVSFMRIFDAVGKTVKQGGRRRGALMGALRVDHPDILEFISCKEKPGTLEAFNISVVLSPAFMAALAGGGKYVLVNPRTGKPAGELAAADVFDRICRCAWATGEPGILIEEHMNAANPTPELGSFETTNPCGETELLPYESCILASVNLARMVRDGQVDWEKLARTARLGVHLLDNAVEEGKPPLPVMEEAALGNRKIGLGVMGFAEMLVKLGIPYDDQGALDTASAVMRRIRQEADDESCRLAETHGVFPNFGRSVYAKSGPRFRNATRTAIAPTGSISMIAGVTGGVEPIFSVGLRRKNILDGAEFFDLHPLFEEAARREGFYSEELVRRVSSAPSIADVPGVSEHVRRLFRTAHDVAPEWHVRMQAAFQEHTDNSVSKTVNLPRNATPDDAKRVFLLAHELGCKGVTVYRDGSRDGQPMSAGTSAPAVRKPAARPPCLAGNTHKLKTGCGNIFITVTRDGSGRLQEVYVLHGKAGVCSHTENEALGRLASLALRSGVDSKEIERQLAGITCNLPAGIGPHKVLSCPDAVAKVLRLEREADVLGSPDETHVGAATCPECGAALYKQGHCDSCRCCGFSRCG